MSGGEGSLVLEKVRFSDCNTTSNAPLESDITSILEIHPSTLAGHHFGVRLQKRNREKTQETSQWQLSSPKLRLVRTMNGRIRSPFDSERQGFQRRTAAAVTLIMPQIYMQVDKSGTN